MADLLKSSGLEQITGIIAERWNQEGSTVTSGTGTGSNIAVTILTVTSGKTFYCKSISFNGSNGQNNPIRDSTTTKITLFSNDTFAQNDVTFPSPIAFETSVNWADTDNGTWTVTVVGWEE